MEIDILSLMGMEVDNTIDEDEGDEVQDAKDLQILERWRMVREGVVEGDAHDEGDTDDEDDDIDDDNSDCDEYMPAFAIRGDNF